MSATSTGAQLLLSLSASMGIAVPKGLKPRLVGQEERRRYVY